MKQKIVRIAPDGIHRALFSLVLQFLYACNTLRADETPVMDLRNNINGYQDPDRPWENSWGHYFDQPKMESVSRTDDSSYGYPCFLSAAQIAEGHNNIQKYLQVRTHILDKVRHFSERHFAGHRVLGIHVRGTDSFMDRSRPHLPTKFISHKIDLYMDRLGIDRLFLCTDQAHTVDRFRSLYEDRLVCYPARRLDMKRLGLEDSPLSIHAPENDIPPYRRGEDCLIETLLLSRVDFLLKTYSNMTHFSVMKNPDVEYIDLDYRFFDPEVFDGKKHGGYTLPARACLFETLQDEQPYIKQAIRFQSEFEENKDLGRLLSL